MNHLKTITFASYCVSDFHGTLLWKSWSEIIIILILRALKKTYQKIRKPRHVEWITWIRRRRENNTNQWTIPLPSVARDLERFFFQKYNWLFWWLLRAQQLRKYRLLPSSVLTELKWRFKTFKLDLSEIKSKQSVSILWVSEESSFFSYSLFLLVVWIVWMICAEVMC